MNSLQHAYNSRRSKITDGTPQVSPQFFDAWRNAGLPRAVGYLIQREKQDLGKPDANPELKAAANLVGSVLLLTGIEKFVQKRKQEKETSSRRSHRLALTLAEAGLLVTYRLLFFAQDGGGGVGGEDDSCYTHRD